MSDFNGKKVLYGALPGPIFIPNYGQLRQELSSTGDGLHKSLDMTVCEPWVTLELKDKVGKAFTVLIPMTSFTHMVIAR